MPGRVLEGEAARARLVASGVPLPASTEVDDPRAAAAAFAELGRDRVVLKAGGLVHKSDAGGVVMGLASAEEVETAATDLVARLGEDALPLVLQEQCEGTEILVGLRRAAGLGTVLVVGAGGVLAEILTDVGRARVPVDRAQARRMIGALRVHAILAGARGAPPGDVDALVELVVAVSDLARRHDDLVELDLNPVLVAAAGSGVLAVDARMVVEAPGDDDRGPNGHHAARASAARTWSVGDLDRLLAPRHVAVVGVSDDESKVGARLFSHLLRHGFDGRLDPVHPAGGRVQGYPRAPSLSALDTAPDLVCVAVPAQRVVEVAREAAAVGAGAVLVHSSDFAEIGEDGRALQDELVRVLSDAGIPLAGPNDMGVVAPGSRLAASISGTLGVADLLAGGIALVSSSGALGSCLASRWMGQGQGMSYWIHAGNEADVTIADYLRWLADDPSTRVVGLLLEDIKDGDAFVAAARALVDAGKPVFAYHMVRSSKGQEAALSHTGAMVGSFELRETVLEAAGVVSLGTLQELEDAVALASVHGLPRGRRLVALTFSGGACTIIADAAEESGLELPDLDEDTRESVRVHLPSFAAVRNPLDVSFQLIVEPDRFRAALGALLAGRSFDAALVQFTTNADPGAARTADAVVETMQDLDVPLYVSRYGGTQLAPKAMEVYRRAGVPVLDAPDRAMRAIAALARAAEIQRPS